MIHHYSIYYYIDNFNSKEILNLDRKINIILRNYKKKISNNEYKKIVNFFKKRRQKIYLAYDIKKAINYKFDGFYIPSFYNLSNFKNKNFPKNFKVIGSAHNQKQILEKIKQDCDEIFFSSIFKSYKNKYLGIVKFNINNLSNTKKIIALGGLNEKNIKKIKLTKAKGFASISWIKKTGLQLSRPV